MRISLLLCLLTTLCGTSIAPNVGFQYSTSRFLVFHLYSQTHLFIDYMRRLGIHNPEVLTIWFINVPGFLITFASVMLLDRLGRKTLLLLGLSVGLVSTTSMFIGSVLTLPPLEEKCFSGKLWNENGGGNASGWLVIIGLCLGQVAIGLGPAFLHSFMPGELCVQVSESSGRPE